MIQSKTNYQLPITNYHGASGTISTTVENPLQISPFLTNKPNFRKSQMNVNVFITMSYEKKDTWWTGKNKANSKPIQTQYKANSNPKQTQFKPNTKPISERPKMNVNKVLTRDYENKSHFAAIAKQAQTNPIWGFPKRASGFSKGLQEKFSKKLVNCIDRYLAMLYTENYG